MTIEFIGIRAGHGTTTVALATAALLAQHRPCRIAAHNPTDLCALAGVCVAPPPSELVHHLDIVDIGEPADVIDAGALPAPPVLDGFSIRPADIASDPSIGLRVCLIRGRDYLGLRTLCGHAGEPLAGLVVLAEADRVLERRDIETVAGRTVLAEIRLCAMKCGWV